MPLIFLYVVDTCMEDEDLQLNYDKMMDILINDEYELSLY